MQWKQIMKNLIAGSWNTRMKNICVTRKKKYGGGIRCVILIPMIFLMLMFSMDSSKVVFLVLWIVSLFTISAYLIYVEYMDYTLQERLTELGIKEDGKIDTLLPNSSIDSRLAEMERKIAADRAILAKIFWRVWDYAG